MAHTAANCDNVICRSYSIVIYLWDDNILYRNTDRRKGE